MGHWGEAVQAAGMVNGRARMQRAVNRSGSLSEALAIDMVCII